MGTGLSNEALLWTRGSSSGIVVGGGAGWWCWVGCLSLCDKRMRLRAARGNPGTQSKEEVGINHSGRMSGERMEDQKCVTTDLEVGVGPRVNRVEGGVIFGGRAKSMKADVAEAEVAESDSSISNDVGALDLGSSVAP